MNLLISEVERDDHWSICGFITGIDKVDGVFQMYQDSIAECISDHFDSNFYSTNYKILTFNN